MLYETKEIKLGQRRISRLTVDSREREKMRGNKGNRGISMVRKPGNPGRGEKDFSGRSQEMLPL